MNVYIMADLEGISGVYCPEQVIMGQSRFDEGRRFLTREINICAEACKAAGADQVYVRDAHGGSYAVIWDQLSDAVDVMISGNTADVRYEGLADCDAVILLGYHAMAGTARAVLEHSWSSKSIQNLYMNGERVGEIAMDAAVAAEHHKPILMVSGDTAVCAEAKHFLPWVVTAEVKKSVNSCFGVQLFAPARAEKILREAVQKSIENYRSGQYEFPKLQPTVQMRVEYTERTQLPSQSGHPYIKVIDGRTFEYVANSVEEAIRRML